MHRLFNKKFLLLFILSGLNFSSFSQKPEPVPFGSNILTNGIIETEEWKDSKITFLDSSLIIRVKQDNKYFYLSIEFLKEKHTGVDLFLASQPEETFILHISSTIGWKKKEANKWGEIIWELPELWTGNTVGIYADDNGERHIIKPRGFEFQIDKKLIDSDEWWIRIHLKRPEKILPSNTSEDNITRWYGFKLSH